MSKFRGLTFRLIGWVVVSAAVALAVFGVYCFALNMLVSNVGETGRAVKTEYLDEFQQYVTENRLSTNDYEWIYEWTLENHTAYLMLAKDGQVIFDSDYPTKEELNEDWDIIMDTNIDDLQSALYNVYFTDGTAQAFIIVLTSYKYYHFFFMSGILLAGLVFLLVFVSRINKSVRYIKRLKAEVQLMEGGTLDKPVEIYGSDELTDLANGLEQMRISLNENMRTERQLTIANRNLITGMSHDLRTPLTSLLMYLEILHSRHSLTEEDMQYLNKSYNKAMQIKNLSDQLFEFFLISKESETRHEPPQKIESVLTDYLSELSMILSKQGFQAETKLEWQEAAISVRHDFLGRIMDNITSNLLKYADPSKKIIISTVSYNDLAGVKFSNFISPERKPADSTGIGVTNIQLMMNNMGECRINETKFIYETELLFYTK